jgi:hypothetical protein
VSVTGQKLTIALQKAKSASPLKADVRLRNWHVSDGPEQIVTLLRQLVVLMAQSKSAPEAWREAGISHQNYAMNCSTARSSTA